MNPAGYHLVNILLHAANALLVWRVLARLRVPGAWLAAVLFALHPVQVESVAWISERKNVLMVFFFMLTLLAWMKFIDEQSKRPWRFYALALVLYALALSAKTTACTMPAALLLILWLKKMPIHWRRLAQVAPFVIMGIGMGLVAIWWEHHNQGDQPQLFDIGPVERVLIASRALWFYAGHLLWPAHLMVEYPRWTISASDPRAYVWLAATAALGVVIWRVRRWTGRSVEVAVMFFAATLSPLLGFIMLYPFAYSFVADHYQYLAGLGLMALAAAGIQIGLDRMGEGKRALQPVLTAVVMLTLGALTWQQCGIYTNGKTLWEATLLENPNSLLAHSNLGIADYSVGRTEESIAHFQKALETHPNYAALHYNLGLDFYQLGRMDEAITQYNKELEVSPNDPLVYNNLGLALAKKGEADAAIAAYQKALAIKPDLGSAHDALGIALLKKGKVDEAIAHLLKAEQIEPRLAGEQNSLGIAFAKKGQLAEADGHFKKALQTNSRDVEARGNLAWLLATASDASVRDGVKALVLAQQASQLASPDDAMVLQALAAAEAETGNYPEAIAAARGALELAVNQNNEPLSGNLQTELKLYEAGRPARDTPARWAWQNLQSAP